MPNIQENLTLLKNTKAFIKSAIEAKGVSDVGDTFSSYPDKIASISTGTAINNQDKTITANGSYSASSGYTGLGTVTVNVPASVLSTPKLAFGWTTFTTPDESLEFMTFVNQFLPKIRYAGEHLFRQCNFAGTNIDLTGLRWGTPGIGINNYFAMFAQASGISDLRIGSIQGIPYNVQQSLDMAFYMCEANSITISEYLHPVNIGALFAYCSQLTSIDINNFDLTYCTDMEGSVVSVSPFEGCSQLSSLSIGPEFFSATKDDLNYDFTGCENVQYMSPEHLNPQESSTWERFLDSSNDLFLDFGIIRGNHENATLTLPQSWISAIEGATVNGTSAMTYLTSKWQNVVASTQ